MPNLSELTDRQMNETTPHSAVVLVTVNFPVPEVLDEEGRNEFIKAFFADEWNLKTDSHIIDFDVITS